MKNRKFRAWDKETQGMFYLGTIYDILKTQAEMSDENWLLCTDHELMESTGLCDCNGKEIYEGDIIKIGGTPPSGEKEEEWNYNAVIEFDELNAMFYLKGECLDGWTGNTKSEAREGWEVVGNVHENPELLKDKQ